MRSFYRHSVQVAASYLSIALMATGTLGAGQMSPPAASVQTNDGQSSGGWKRVGEMQTPDQGGNYPQDPSVGNGNNQGPPRRKLPTPAKPVLLTSQLLRIQTKDPFSSQATSLGMDKHPTPSPTIASHRPITNRRLQSPRS
jgi:hypothetical protein